MKTKSEFSFRSLDVVAERTICLAPVAASVRKSQPRWVIFRIDKATAKATQFKEGSILSPFIDEANRALLFLSDQRPTPPNARRYYGKDGSLYIELPRKAVLEELFPIGPIRPLTLCEATHGRLVVQVPK